MSDNVFGRQKAAGSANTPSSFEQDKPLYMGEGRMVESEKDEKTCVWTDLLIVLILSNFVLQNVQQWPLAPLLLVVFAFFACAAALANGHNEPLLSLPQ